MLKILMGKKGVGKTKVVIQMANESVETVKGNVAFIDDDNRYMYELKRPIRFIDASDYGIDDPSLLLGFIAGVMARDYDLETLYIDGFLKIVGAESLDGFESFFERLSKLTKDLDVIISIKGEPENAPDFVKGYLI